MKRRIHSIDIVRGIVMIIMAIDHTRDLLHFSSLSQDPTNLATTTPAIFLARWITHLCAPTFVFLSGLSVYLSLQRQGNVKEAASFLRKRGLWLLLLEITLVNFAIWFDVQYRIVMFQVIATIGAGFIVLSFLLRSPAKITGAVAVAIIVLHNLLPLVPVPANPVLAAGRNLLFAPGIIPLAPGHLLLISYPWVQWIAIMMLGFSMGKILERPAAETNKMFIRTGLLFITGFILLRFINVYGDPFPWQQQNNDLFTVMSFFNVTKYPPSLQYILLFVGIAFILLRYADQLPRKIKNILLVYGRVPMFYYLLHFYLIRLATFIMVYAQGFEWKDLLFGPFQLGRPATGSGIGLGPVLMVWIFIVALLYPLCKWYGNYRAAHPEKKWLRYL